MMRLCPECHAAFFTRTGLTEHDKYCIGYVPDETVPASGVGSNQGTALPAGFLNETTHSPSAGNSLEQSQVIRVLQRILSYPILRQFFLMNGSTRPSRATSYAPAFLSYYFSITVTAAMRLFDRVRICNKAY